MSQEIIAIYKENCKISNEKITQLSRKSNWFSILRLLVLLGGGTLIFQVMQTENVMLTLLSFIITILGFLVLIWFQSKVNNEKKELEHFLKVNENELAVAEDIKRNVYSDGERHVDDHHLYTSDLDVFGSGSVFQLMNRCATLQGNELLSKWLCDSSTKDEIEKRQEFAQEIASDLTWWQDFQSKLYAIKDSTIDVNKAVSHYLVNTIDFPKTKVLAYYTFIVPFLSLAFFLVSFYQPVFISILIFFAIFNLLLSMSLGKYVGAASAGLNKGGKFLASYYPAIRKIEERNWSSIQAKDLKYQVQEASGEPVSNSIEKLSTLLNRLDARLNILVGAVLNMFSLWDFRQIYALQKWQKDQSTGILEALHMLSMVEAVGSLGQLKNNHEKWIFPTITNNAPTLEVTDIEHPLIPENTSIENSYSLSTHRIALITGSNMAGKSTFLRTIGVNAVLAFCGAPVHADKMEISVMQLATYMRIRDSLNESTSTFKAELDRIQKILALVKTNDKTFILLDEMLRGTNSMDKYLGSKAIIEKLIEQNGKGMVATHDLKLSELADEHPQIVENFHFDIKVEGEEMLFDYKLKNGPCTTFNASLLLKKIGIEI